MTASTDPPASGSEAPSRRVAAASLGAVVLVGAVVRIAILVAGHGTTIDSDESIFGIMGIHILERGTLPVVYYGQQYMGAVPSYLALPAFALFGATPIALKGTIVVLDLLLVGAFYALGRALWSHRVGLAAAWFAAVPPAFLLLYGLKARVFVEPLLLGTFMLAGVSLLGRLDGRRQLALAASIGLASGVGVWANTLIGVYFPAVALVWLVSVPPRRLAPTLGCALGGAVVGAGPFLAYNAASGFGSFGHLAWVDLRQAATHLRGVLGTGWSVIGGARGPWADRDSWRGLGAMLGALYLAGACGYVWAVAREARAVGLARTVQRLAPALVAATVLAAFCFSAYGREVREPRYLGGLYPWLALCLAWPVGLGRRRAAAIAGAVLIALAGLHLAVVSRWDPALLLPISGGRRVAPDHAELVAALEAREIRSLYTDYWVAYRLAFETHEAVRTSTFGHVVLERVPEYTEAVASDPHAAFLLMGDAARGFRARLTAQGIAFREDTVEPYHLFYGLPDPHGPAQWTYPF